MHRQRQSRTSTSKFRQSFRELIRLSLILATHMLTLPSGRQKQKILLQDSLRTSRNTRATNSEKHLLQQVRRSKIQKYLKQQLCRMRRKGRYCIAYAVSSFSAVSSGQYTFFSRSAILQQTFIQIGRDRSFIDYLSFPVSRDGTVVGRVPVLFLPFEIRFSGLEKKAAGRQVLCTHRRVTPALGARLLRSYVPLRYGPSESGCANNTCLPADTLPVCKIRNFTPPP